MKKIFLLFGILSATVCSSQTIVGLSKMPGLGALSSGAVDIGVFDGNGYFTKMSKANFVIDITTQGTFQPTLTSITNVSANTSYNTTKYYRIGNMVTVFGKFQVDPTSTGATELDMTFPIASNVSGDDDVAGSGSSNNITGEVLTFLAETTNHRVRIMWNATDVTNRTVYFQYSYQIK